MALESSSVMKNWIVDINKRTKEMGDYSPELDRWKNRSIYKVPNHVVEENDKSYRPQVVSLGPYHYGGTSLKQMEEHKERALLHFLKRSAKPLEKYVDAFMEQVEDFTEMYDQLDPYWQNTNAFLKLMILDGCFILEILRAGINLSTDYNDYDDPIFGRHGRCMLLPLIKRDMLLLENQVPFRVLEGLMAVTDGQDTGPEIKDKILKLIFESYFPSGSGQYTLLRSVASSSLHILDAYHKALTYPIPRSRVRFGARLQTHEDGIFPSATGLHEAGVRFRRSHSLSLTAISFRDGTLKLPQIVIDDTFRTVFANLMAFERIHVSAGYKVTSYVFLISCLIGNSEDVSLLKSYGVLTNAVGTDKEVVKLFGSISKDIVLDPEDNIDVIYRKVRQQLRKRFRRRLNYWRIDLLKTYFRTPWGVLSVVAAIILFTLTAIQTVYTVLSYTDNK